LIHGSKSHVDFSDRVSELEEWLGVEGWKAEVVEGRTGVGRGGDTFESFGGSGVWSVYALVVVIVVLFERSIFSNISFPKANID
jgi:hypothetical protein